MKNRRTYVIDPTAFFAALIGAPLLIALLGFWALLIPVFAVVIGGPFYLLVGTPLLLWYLGRFDVNAGGIALMAFLAVLIPWGLLMSVAWMFDDPTRRLDRVVDSFSMIGLFGLFFAPLWGFAFAFLYRAMRRDIYAQPI